MFFFSVQASLDNFFFMSDGVTILLGIKFHFVSSVITCNHFESSR